MRKLLGIFIISIIVISSGCSYYRTCPTYTRDAKDAGELSEPEMAQKTSEVAHS